MIYVVLNRKKCYVNHYVRIAGYLLVLFFILYDICYSRAAARSKINEHEAALRDCEQALNLEPGYGKAFGRKG